MKKSEDLKNTFKADLSRHRQFGFSNLQRPRSEMLLWPQICSGDSMGFLWFVQEVCQPFLYIHENTVYVSGVLDYDAETQTGTFRHMTKDGILEVPFVHSYAVFVKMNDRYLPAHSKNMPEKEEVSDIYLAATIVVNGFCSLVLYHNCELIYKHPNNVYEAVCNGFFGNPVYTSCYGYFRFAEKCGDNTYINYLYNIKNEKLYRMDDSEGCPSWLINYRDYETYWNRHGSQIKDGTTIRIHIHLNSSKTSQVVEEFIKDADQCEVIDSLFDDDATINIIVEYNDRPKDVRFLYYCAKLEPSLFGDAIYNIPVGDLDKGTLCSEREYKYVLTMNEETLFFYKQLNRQLHEKAGETPKVNQLPKMITDNYISHHDMIGIMYRYLRDGYYGKYEAPWILQYMGKTHLNLDNEKSKYNELFKAIAREKKLKTRWVNEYSLYKLIVDSYPDAIYQYHAEWLGNQSLDIYIPSIRVGIEYQGVQHYSSVEMFGGEEALHKRIKLDELKKQKCRENQVKLLEWKYTEPISDVKLKEKMDML